MREIKFSCPQCQQHIGAEPSYAGMEIACPVCTTRMMVPGTRPDPPPAPVPAPVSAPPPIPMSVASAPAAPTSGLAISRPPATTAPPPPVRPAPAFTGAPARPAPVSSAGNNMGMGVLGILLGAFFGSGLMYGFYYSTGIRFPWLGVGIGALTAYGGRVLYKGTSSSLGGIAAAVAAVSVVGTLFLIYGEFPLLSIISVVVSVMVAYRIAS